jgi:hypothetical protein
MNDFIDMVLAFPQCPCKTVANVFIDNRKLKTHIVETLDF